MCINYDGNTFTNKFLHAHQKKSCDFARWDGKTWLTSGLISFTASVCCYARSEMYLSSKYFCIIVFQDCVSKQQHPPSKAMTAFIVFRLLALRRKSFNIDENYYIQWLLLLFLVVYCAGWSGSDDFVLFDSLDETLLFSKKIYAIFQLNSQL